MKIITTLFILIAAITVNAQKVIVPNEHTDIKFLIAKERVERIEKDIRTQIANQFIRGDLQFENETETFLNAINAAVSDYANAITSFDTIQIDTAQLKAEYDSIWLKASEAESSYVIENSQGYKALLKRIAELEKLLNNSVVIPEYAEWVQPTGAHDAYTKGSKVLYSKKIWESLIDANVWAPGVAGWREISKQ